MIGPILGIKRSPNLTPFNFFSFFFLCRHFKSDAYQVRSINIDELKEIKLNMNAVKGQRKLPDILMNHADTEWKSVWKKEEDILDSTYNN